MDILEEDLLEAEIISVRSWERIVDTYHKTLAAEQKGSSEYWLERFNKILFSFIKRFENTHL